MLRVTDLTKHFHFYRHPWDRVVETLSGGRLRRSERFVALDGVSFEVRRGGSLGVVGMNGAGKSTLLRLIAGTLYPTSGTIEAGGRIASLLELGTGFHPAFTGRQNAEMNARFLGLGEEEIAARMGDVIAFAELGPFIDRTLRTYSAGMLLRLGFAVAVNVEADILLIDEALAVGDLSFQQKCIARVLDIRRRGVSTVFVSHDFAAVRALCDEVALLHHGRIVERGAPAAALERYNALIAGHGREEAPGKTEAGAPRRFGNGAATIEAVEVGDAHGTPLRALICGAAAEIRVRVRFHRALARPTVGILLRDRFGNDVFGTNTFLQRLDTGDYAAGQAATFVFRLQVDLGPADYSLAASVHSGESHVQDCYDWIDRCLWLRVLAPAEQRSVGSAYLRAGIAVERDPSSAPAA
jgi:lipopolysaccharide transport system ATP-binding protein